MTPKAIAKLPYYLLSLNSLRRIATARSIARCAVLRGRRLTLTDGSVLELSGMIDLLVVKETLCDDVYGLAELNALDGVVVDVGAGIGDFTIAAASRSPRLRVLSYEPNPSPSACWRGMLQRRDIRTSRSLAQQSGHATPTSCMTWREGRAQLPPAAVGTTRRSWWMLSDWIARCLRIQFGSSRSTAKVSSWMFFRAVRA